MKINQSIFNIFYDDRLIIFKLMAIYHNYF